MIFVFEGTIGAGKTVAMTWCLFQDYLQNRKIYANYHLTFEYQYLTGLGDFSKWPKEPCSIGIDEAHSAGMDSRGSMSPINKFYSKNMTQSRKIASHIYMSVQHFGMLDIRVRQICGVLFGPEIVEYDRSGVPNFISLQYTTRPWAKGWEDEFEIPLDMGAGNVCQMFDTSEIIDEMDNPMEATMQELAVKYAHLAGKTLKAISAVLYIDEGLAKADAEWVSQYIKAHESSPG